LIHSSFHIFLIFPLPQDLSPILAFFLLNVLTNVTAAVGAEVTPDVRKKLQKSYSPFVVNYNNNNNVAKEPLPLLSSITTC
jgi:hypothetical protein